MKVIRAEDAFQILRNPKDRPIIDVRSEDEFQDGHFTGVVNVPILNNLHRHQVGLTYKQKGQDIAIAEGHKLVDPLKPQLLEQWQAVSGQHQPIVYCWRGGLRSKISCAWMEEKNIRPQRVEGGYKAIRQIARTYFDQRWSLLLISGMTGAQKTEVLNQVPNPIDLEALAHHRGSAFGLLIQSAQPSQGTFENNLAVSLSNADTKRPLILEDESRIIGQCVVPHELYAQLMKASLVKIEATPQQRAEHIYKSYVLLSLQKAERGQVREHFQKSLLKISKKLGGLLTDQLLKVMNEAFFHNDQERHLQWIESLLVNYYDKQYLHALNKKGRPVVFQGSRQEVQEYLTRL